MINFLKRCTFFPTVDYNQLLSKYCLTGTKHDEFKEIYQISLMLYNFQGCCKTIYSIYPYLFHPIRCICSTMYIKFQKNLGTPILVAILTKSSNKSIIFLIYNNTTIKLPIKNNRYSHQRSTEPSKHLS